MPDVIDSQDTAPIFDASVSEQRAWYVARTQPRHEKCVASHLNTRGVDHFLPVYEKLSQWKDRRMRVRLPLFPGYVFVHLAYAERFQALSIPSVMGLVTFGGKPAAVDSHELEVLRRGLDAKGLASPCPYLKTGQRVRVVSGIFAGLTGIIRRRQGHTRLVVSIDDIQRSIALSLDGAEVEPISASSHTH